MDLDFLTQIINVQWEEGEHFLYSGADGMFGSEDGKTWVKAPSAKPATSLAWIDDVWVAAGGPLGTWRSEDGAKTWESVSTPIFEEVAAMQPKGKDANGKLLPGVFAGWVDDFEADKSHVYTSHDLGKTWKKVLTIDTVVPFTDSHGDSQDGSRSVQELSGCGGVFFFCIQYQANRYAGGDGVIYRSIDGKSFSGPTMVFGPGTNLTPDDPEYFTTLSRGFSADSVAFDEKTKTYTCVGFGQVVLEHGVVDYRILYTQSRSPSFVLGEGTILAKETIANFLGNLLSGPYGAAGGNGTFATGGHIVHDFFGAGESTTDIMAYLGDKAQKLLTTSSGAIGSFCFKKDGKATESTESPDTPPGTFACTAVGDAGGGVFIAKAGDPFVKTLSGSDGPVAVGKVSFLGSSEPNARL